MQLPISPIPEIADLTGGGEIEHRWDGLIPRCRVISLRKHFATPMRIDSCNYRKCSKFSHRYVAIILPQKTSLGYLFVILGLIFDGNMK